MKRIISCSDGTWNHPDETDEGQKADTNVLKLHNFIAAEATGSNGEIIKQVKFYDRGIGTTSKKSANILEGITGAGLDQNIKDGYNFIMNQYEDGDEIYLFGFSRGAYTARSIAGFIRNCGILKNGYYHLLDEAYTLYRDRTDKTTPDSGAMKDFKSKYCYEPRIKMIGVWDTVGSLGLPLNVFKKWNFKKYAFHDVMLSRIVDYAYHALAIQERRKTFEPTLWEKNEDVDPEHQQVLEQVWFTGVHSNIGGGYADAGLSNITLKWMMCKAENVGLHFKIEPMFLPDIKGVLRNSATWYYKLLGLGWRSICDKENTAQMIHKSVANRDVSELPPLLQNTYSNFLSNIDDDFVGG